jgi:hypothetical protein
MLTIVTIGKGYEGYNNIVFLGTATTVEYEFDNGQENIAIGYKCLLAACSYFLKIYCYW